MELASAVDLLEIADGRDYFSRVIQYTSLFLKWRFKGWEDGLAKDFDELYERTKYARKMMRVLKTVTEIKKIMDILRTSRKFHPYARISVAFSRVCYTLYWVLDTLFALIHCGFLRPNEGKQQLLSTVKMLVWFSGILSSFIYNSINLRISYKQESDLKRTVMVSEASPQEIMRTLERISDDRRLIMYNLIRNFGDLMVATREVKLDKLILRTKFNNGIIGIFGMISSIIALLQIYRKQIEPKAKQTRYRKSSSVS
eukprot:TRINITY_DN10449_c0_g2_i1.p1 TRINITY_DN10449_c0_g2~~TRINITY_DN10449_c0_g2_i1.p1  ORF type:complete len:256 (-),score=33.46 TRINITY_DN10449_c0_g2_i1:35-802(-)